MCARAEPTSEHGPGCPGSTGTGLLPLGQAWRVPPPQGANKAHWPPSGLSPSPGLPGSPLKPVSALSVFQAQGRRAAPVCSGPSQAGCQLQPVDSRPGPTCHRSPGLQAEENKGMAFPVPGDLRLGNLSSFISPGSRDFFWGVVVRFF